MKLSKSLIVCGSGSLFVALVVAAQSQPTTAPSATQPVSPATASAAHATSTAATAPALRPLETEVIKLTLRPSATTRPALRYTLLPPVVDQTPGDASPLYMIAVRRLPEHERYTKLFPESSEDWWETPLDKLPMAEIEPSLAAVAESLRYVDIAARRQEAGWDTSIRQEGFNAMLPYLNDLRWLTNLLTLRMRVQLAGRNWADAERSMQSGFSMARQLNQESVFVQYLVGIGIAEAMLSRGVWEWIGRGDSPNLYWALSGLQNPFMDPGPVRAWEQASLAFTDPQFASALAGTLPPEEWPAVLAKLGKIAASTDALGLPPPAMTDAERTAKTAQLIEATQARARQSLIDAGLPKYQVNAMPAGQAVGTYFVREYADLSDEFWKGWELPYYQSLKLIDQQEQERIRRRAESPNNPLLSLLPRNVRSRHGAAHLDRNIALLRTIEAIRDYVARHEGGLPERLEQMTDLPLPLDPMTNRPFAYRVDGRTAIIDRPSPRGVRMQSHRYELTFER